MFETFGLFVASYLLTWPALLLVLFLGIIFEHRGARGWAVFAGLTAMVISYFYFSIPLETIGFYALAYLIVGVVWSFWRYNVFVKDSVKRLQMRSWANSDHKESAIANLSPSNNLNRITAWIIIWPFSAIENLLGDIINAIQALVTKVFKGVYHKIFTAHTQSLLARVEE